MKTLVLNIVFTVLVSISFAQPFAFTESAVHPFSGISNSCSRFKDLNGDGNIDIIISGVNGSGNVVINTYLNDGYGRYTLLANPVLTAVINGSIDFDDVDGNGSIDMAVSGLSYDGTSWIAKTKLYLNDGAGNYTESTQSFPPLSVGTVHFIDIDNDGVNELLLTGMLPSGGPLSYTGVYRNNGSGVFTEDTGVNLPDIGNSSLDFHDINGDGYVDLLIAGYSSQTDEHITNIFYNDATGNFITPVQTYFAGVKDGRSLFIDVDGDADMDVFIFGSDASFNRVAKLYLNDGNGVYTESVGTTFEPVQSGDAFFADLNGDGSADLIYSGQSGSGAGVFIYENRGGGNFTLVSSPVFENTSHGSLSVADVDNDGDLDVYVSGKQGSSSIGKLYRNRNICTESSSTFTHTACGSFVWEDQVTYTASNNTAIIVLPNANRYECDSTIHLALTIHPENIMEDVVSACDYYRWRDGITYTSGNTIAEYNAGDNMFGCDSVYKLNLTIKQTTYSTQYVTGCDSYEWMNGVTYTTNNNTAQYVVGLNSQGCDSIVKLNLIMKQKTYKTDVVTHCGSYRWIDGNTYTADNNTAQYVVGENSQGCDSIHKLNLTITNLVTSVDEIFACGSYTWIDGVTYTASNNTAVKVINLPSGCDSVITLNLTIDNVSNSININGSVISAVYSGASYQWLDCNNNDAPVPGATSQHFIPSVPGRYAVRITKNACEVTSPCATITTVGVEETEAGNLLVYPNPVKEELTIKKENGFPYSLNISDINGKIIFKREGAEGTVKVDFSEWNKGVYILEVEQNGTLKREKIIKE